VTADSWWPSGLKGGTQPAEVRGILYDGENHGLCILGSAEALIYSHFLGRSQDEGGETWMLKLAEKEAIVKELISKLGEAKMIILTDYRGLNVAEMNELRRRLREAEVEIKVFKNTLAKRAADEVGLTDINPYLEGTNAMVLGYEDEIEPAKILHGFIKEYKKAAIKVGMLDGNLLDKQQVERLAGLPGREVLLAQVLGGFQAPIRGLVTVLDANISGLARVINAIKEQQEQAS
jgi:large subunit ribosomal protein L10